MRLRDFQQDINKKFKVLTQLLGEVSESVRSPRAKALLTSALEFVKPHHLALGLRVSRLSTTRIEVVVPIERRFKKSANQPPAHLSALDMILDPGVLTTAAVMGSQLLMQRLDLPHLGLSQIRETHFRALGTMTSDLRGRLELTKLAQEALRAELKKNGSSEIELVMSFFDESERLVADCTLSFHCQAADQIDWKGSHESTSHPS